MVASKDQIQHPPRILAAILMVYQSKHIDKLFEFVCFQRLCETICYHLKCGNPLELNCPIVNQIASFMIFDGDVLGFAVILWVFRQLDGSLVVCMDEGIGGALCMGSYLQLRFRILQFHLVGLATRLLHTQPHVGQCTLLRM